MLADAVEGLTMLESGESTEAGSDAACKLTTATGDFNKKQLSNAA